MGRALSPCLYPLLLLEELTLRAVPVPAGIVGYLEVAALLALVDMTPENRGPADLYRVHGAQVSEGEFMGFSVRGAVDAEDVGHLCRGHEEAYSVSKGLLTCERPCGLTWR